MKAAKWFVVGIAIAAMIGAPLLAGQETIFGYLQKMNGIYFIPIFSVVVVGMLHPRIPSTAAAIAMLAGVFIIAVGYFVPPVANAISGLNEFHFLGIVFAALVIFLLVMGTVAPRAEAWKIETRNTIDMTPWKGAYVASGILVILVLAIYISFSK